MKRFLLAAALLLFASPLLANGYVMDSYGNTTFFNQYGNGGNIIQPNGSVIFFQGVRPRPFYPIAPPVYQPYPYYQPMYQPYRPWWSW